MTAQVKQKPRLTKIEDYETDSVKGVILVDTETHGRDFAITHFVCKNSFEKGNN